MDNAEFDDCVAIRETDLALLVEIDNIEIWVPKSVINIDESEITGEGESGMLVVEGWYAVKAGLV